MRLRRLATRGFRNLADMDREIPRAGLVLLGDNAQGKTNLLEAIYYPVLFRSFRAAGDQQLIRADPGFGVELHIEGGPAATLGVVYSARQKRIVVDGREAERLADEVGLWLAVTFLPSDVALASGPAAGRRQYLDRVLSLSDRRYLRALVAYRAALAQRNSALRQGRVELARAFDAPLALAGAALVRSRLEWVEGAAQRFGLELECLGERVGGGLRYRGRPELADAASWSQVLTESLREDQARGATTRGPHRDDLILEVGGRRLRDYGSTGQHRSAAIALKLIEISTISRSRGTEPVLLLDDVFAELDRERQNRLAVRLAGAQERQVFVTSPRQDELPEGLGLPVWEVEDGKVTSR